MEQQTEGQTAKTCGNCRFGHPQPQNMAMVTCFGAPPTPCVMGQRQVGMRSEWHVECLRPGIPRDAPACSLHQPVLLIGQG